MGLDLRILPQYSNQSDFSHDVIGLHRDYDLFEIINNLENEKGVKAPNTGIGSFCGTSKKIEGSCYGDTIDTPYGERICSVMSKDLKDALSNYNTESWKNKAFLAFINELPNDLMIWLYWH